MRVISWKLLSRCRAVKRFKSPSRRWHFVKINYCLSHFLEQTPVTVEYLLTLFLYGQEKCPKEGHPDIEVM